jgi:hypothetical protein
LKASDKAPQLHEDVRMMTTRDKLDHRPFGQVGVRDHRLEIGPHECIRFAETLLALLHDEWQMNHAEHCGTDWPHADGKRCNWPRPDELAFYAPSL